jgi:4-amino-4-deoxy-L-arabinose transferase-like glycosyltransferase
MERRSSFSSFVKPASLGWPISMVGVGLFSLIVSYWVSSYVTPVVSTHDEFSYLLAADTLLHGRMSNPTPAAWQSLQSLHLIMQPTYASKYPLGSGVIVALGWALFGDPMMSSWLSGAWLAAAICWMLAGALPRRWALFGGIVVALHPILQVTWAQSLLQGYVTATGCALLTGAVLRLRRRFTSHASLVGGLGISLLALTRPFEGLVCTVLCAAVLWWLWQGQSITQRLLRSSRVASLAMIPIGLTLILIAKHNQSVTGEWWTLPYQVHESQFGVAPLFVFSSPRLENVIARDDLSETVRKFHAETSLDWYRSRNGLYGWWLSCKDLCYEACLLGFPFAWVVFWSISRCIRSRVVVAFSMAIVLQIAASASVCWVFSHYAAPLLPWLVLLSMVAARKAAQHLNLTRHGTFVASTCVLAAHIAALCWFSYLTSELKEDAWARDRQAIVRGLERMGGRHLVLVRYDADHNVHQEWVYNLADPGSSRIVWARDERADWTHDAVLHYGEGRKIWLLDADRRVLRTQ